jgi:hypothetical protein
MHDEKEPQNGYSNLRVSSAILLSDHGPTRFLGRALRPEEAH